MTRHIDLNSDLGESLGAWRMGDDAAMLDIVSSANVACGFHAGDPAGILGTLRAAHARGVAVGAHVAYPDLVGFGRRNMDVASRLAHTVTRSTPGLKMSMKWLLCPVLASRSCVARNTVGSLMLRRM